MFGGGEDDMRKKIFKAIPNEPRELTDEELEAKRDVLTKILTNMDIQQANTMAKVMIDMAKELRDLKY